MENTIVIYNQAKDAERQLSEIKTFNLNTLELYKQHEETMEVYCQKVFGIRNDKDFFTRIKGASKRFGVAHISKEIGNVLEEINPENIQLVFLGNYTDKVYEKIKYFKSVMKLCGNPDDEAEYSLLENVRKEFVESLAMFIAKQIFVYKLELNQIINPKIKSAIDRLVGIKDRTRTLHAAMWQTAHKLTDGKVNPKEVTKIVLDTYTKEDEELRKIARNNGWGYLQEGTTKKKIEKQKGFFRLKNKDNSASID